MRAALLLVALWLLSGCTTEGGGQNWKPDRQKAAEANAELGLRYMLRGNNEVALAKFTSALKYDDRSVNAHHYLGELYLRLNKVPEAEQHYLAALKYSEDDDPALLNNYGAFLCSQARVEEAEGVFIKVLENPVYRGRANVYENLGICMNRVGRYVEAEEYFRRALGIQPERVSTLLAMAEMRYNEENLLSARAFMQRFETQQQHNSADTLWLAIRIERRLDDLKAVEAYGTQLLTKFPDSREAGRYHKQEWE